jgi:hypothetical protein
LKLHILTAVSRPENLPAIAESLATAAVNAPNVNLAWHWRYDLHRRHVGGQALKNAMLDEIRDGWVWVLDDDTLAHPDVLRVVSEQDADAVIVSQRRTTGAVLVASPERMVAGGVDIGQAFLQRNLIGDHRIPADYNGDGLFLQAVLEGEGEWTTYLPDVLSLHNALSGAEIGV